MYIEDILGVLTIRVKMNPFDSKLIESFFDQTSKGSGLTEKQATIAVKIISKYVDKINAVVGNDLTAAINAPRYKLGIRTITTTKHISVIDSDDSLKRVLKVQFPYNEELLKEIKKELTNFMHGEWSKPVSAWLFTLEDKVISFFSNWVTVYGFTADDEFKDYVAQTAAITADIEKYVPMLVIDNNIIKFVNAHRGVPVLSSNDIVTSLFEARRAGITIWDSGIDDALETSSANTVTKQFIKNTPDTTFLLNLEEHSIQELKLVLENLLPCIIMVPGGNELTKLELAMPLLKDVGITNSEISVLFRLPTETGSSFNKFVKDEQLNSPLSDTTKVVFLSGKIPKTLIESKLQFNCIINFNFYNIHYTLANFLKNHYNVINIVADRNPKGSQIGIV
jgi:hypothetical protein